MLHRHGSRYPTSDSSVQKFGATLTALVRTLRPSSLLIHYQCKGRKISCVETAWKLRGKTDLLSGTIHFSPLVFLNSRRVPDFEISIGREWNCELHWTTIFLELFQLRSWRGDPGPCWTARTLRLRRAPLLRLRTSLQYFHQNHRPYYDPGPYIEKR